MLSNDKINIGLYFYSPETLPLILLLIPVKINIFCSLNSLKKYHEIGERGYKNTEPYPLQII